MTKAAKSKWKTYDNIEKKLRRVLSTLDWNWTVLGIRDASFQPQLDLNDIANF